MKNKVKLGIFFIVTLVLFIGAIILLGKIKLKGDGYRLYVDYVFIGDLQENGKVSYRGGGIQIGFIEKISINPDGTIRVTLFITDKTVVIPEGTKFSIQTVGLGLGEKYIMVSPPATTTTGMASIAAGSVIKGVEPFLCFPQDLLLKTQHHNDYQNFKLPPKEKKMVEDVTC